MSNAAILIQLGLEAALQLQQYQLALAKANAENRDVTDDELAAARAKAAAKIDQLEQLP